ncbi:Hypothetical protein CINCED_3A004979, partial [Cinara cedri]
EFNSTGECENYYNDSGSIKNYQQSFPTTSLKNTDDKPAICVKEAKVFLTLESHNGLQVFKEFQLTGEGEDNENDSGSIRNSQQSFPTTSLKNTDYKSAVCVKEAKVFLTLESHNGLQNYEEFQLTGEGENNNNDSGPTKNSQQSINLTKLKEAKLFVSLDVQDTDQNEHQIFAKVIPCQITDHKTERAKFMAHNNINAVLNDANTENYDSALRNDSETTLSIQADFQDWSDSMDDSITDSTVALDILNDTNDEIPDV